MPRPTTEIPYESCMDDNLDNELATTSWARTLFGNFSTVKGASSESNLVQSYWQRKARKKRAKEKEDSKCRALFNVLDQDRIGMIDRTSMIKLLEESLVRCRLQIQGTDVSTLVDLFMKDAKPGDPTDRKYCTYEDFRHIFRTYICKATNEKTLGSRRSSMAQLVQPRQKSFHSHQSLKSIAGTSERLPMSIRIGTWFSNYKIHIYWLGLYIMLNITSFVWKFQQYSTHNPKALEFAGYGLPIARGFAQVCLLNAALVLLPLARGCTQSLRTIRWLRESIPFDANIKFHAITGYTFVISGFLHTAAQFYYYITKVQKASDEAWYESALAKSGKFSGPRPSLEEFLYTVPGWTGVLLILFTLIATPFTLRFIRKNNFNWFWYSHFFYYPLTLGVLWIHGIQSWLEPTQAWAWITIPVVIYTLDRRSRYKWLQKKQTHTSADEEIGLTRFVIRNASIQAGTLALQIDKPQGTFRDYTPGMYCYLNVPTLSKYEWHPFTLTSCPADDFLTLHIRNAGDWTGALHHLMKEHLIGMKEGFPEIALDGPIGAPAQEYLHYDIVVMIGGGIGVTPMASIIRDTAMRLKDAQCRQCGTVNYPSNMNIQKLYFHWATRDQEAFQWFSDCMNQAAELDTEGRLEIHTHLTGVEKDPYAAALKMMQTYIHARTGHDILSGLKTKSRTHFGRANWGRIFAELTEAHPNTNIGVFFCGSPAFRDEVQDMCLRSSINNSNVTFDFHSENF